MCRGQLLGPGFSLSDTVCSVWSGMLVCLVLAVFLYVCVGETIIYLER